MASMPEPRALPGGFFTSRWRAQVPLRRLFWFDMMLTGTAINVVSSLVALFMLAMKVPAPICLLVHFTPLPYNVFLAMAVWKTAAPHEVAHATAARAGALAWVVAATLL